MNKVVHTVEVVLFRARWLLAPLYLGLVGTLVLLAYRFVIEFIHLAQEIGQSDASTFTLDLLALLDLTLLANLILMVIFAGYENFVSRIDAATESSDRPHWMGTIDFSGLKIKLIGSLVAISVIELLKDFIECLIVIIADTRQERKKLLTVQCIYERFKINILKCRIFNFYQT